MHEDLSFEVASIKTNQSATIGVETRMSLRNTAFATLGCVAILACGSNSPLILDGDEKDVAPGMRTLTSGQEQDLLNAITSAQEPCDAVDGTYLRTVDPGQSESWDVRCRLGVYNVQLFADGTAADVRRCFEWSLDGCVDPNARRRFRQYPNQRAPAGQLNPDLGKLLEKMESGDGK